MRFVLSTAMILLLSLTSGCKKPIPPATPPAYLSTIRYLATEAEARREGRITTFGAYMVPINGSGARYWNEYAIPKMMEAESWLASQDPSKPIQIKPMSAVLMELPDQSDVFRAEWLESGFNVDGFQFKKNGEELATFKHVHHVNDTQKRQPHLTYLRIAVFHVLFSDSGNTSKPNWEGELRIPLEHPTNERITVSLLTSDDHELEPIDVYLFRPKPATPPSSNESLAK